MFDWIDCNSYTLLSPKDINQYFPECTFKYYHVVCLYVLHNTFNSSRPTVAIKLQNEKKV